MRRECRREPLQHLGVLLAVAALFTLTPVAVWAQAAPPHDSAWSVLPSPSPPGPAGGASGAGLSGVACPTSTRCVVVGSYGDNSLDSHPLVGSSNGKNWSIVPAPEPSAHRNSRGRLSAVACPASGRCFGVGSFYNGASTRMLIEQWTGSAWSIVGNPTMPGATKSLLSGIACPTSTSCFAVGYAISQSSVAKILLERWNGKAWSTMSTSKPSGTNQLSGVSCASSTSCVAVGFSMRGSSQQTLIERWNGTSWSALLSPNPPSAIQSSLAAVTCPTTSSCFAVGSYTKNSETSPASLIEQSQGDKWSIAVAATPRSGSGEGSGLGGITCVSATACFAVGYIEQNNESSSRVERWNGQSWSVVAIPAANQFTSEQLAAVTCTSGRACTAVGYTFYGTSIEQWNGVNWSRISAGGSASHLDGISCPSATMCFAVGSSAPGFPYLSDAHAVIERWDGAGWKLVPAPDPSSAGNFVGLSGVSCPSTTSCFAVGLFGPNNGIKALVEHWDGSRWSIVPIANPPGLTNVALTAISCGALTSCFAVGVGQGPHSQLSFVEQWNGTTWTASFLPEPIPGAPATLAGITCPSDSRCLAVGNYADAGIVKTVVEGWDGAQWAVEASPNDPTAHENALDAASCPSTDRCYSVGTRSTTAPDGEISTATLVEQWDGAAWSIVSSANPVGAYASGFTSIACLTSTECVAVGNSFVTGTGAQLAFTELWDGTTWSLVPVPAGAQSSRLSGTACVDARCFAVGNYETQVARWTLVENYP